MSKKRGTPSRKVDSNLDENYISPIKSFNDLTFDNIKSTIINSKYAQCLIILTIIGFILRFYNLGYNSLWLDEASTHTYATMTFTGIWQATVGGEFNPPLFYWIEHFMLMMGDNEVILRFIPAILGVLTIPLIYFAGKEFVDKNVGIISAAGFTFSTYLIFYSQEARAYSTMLFFMTFAMIFYFKAVNTNDVRCWIAFGILSGIAFWSHFYAIVLISSIIIYEILIKIGSFKENIHNFKMIGVSITSLIIVCLPLILPTINLFFSRTSSAPTFGIQGFGIIIETFKQLSSFSELVLFAFVILFVIGILQAFIINKNKGTFLVTTTILTFIISFILSFKMPMVPRYLIFFNIIFFIGIALSYQTIFYVTRNQKVVYGFFALFIIASATMLPNYYSNFSKDDWRGFSNQLQSVTQPNDIVVLVPGYMYQPLDYYYSNESDQTIELMANTGEILENVNKLKTDNHIYFVVTGDIMSANPNGDASLWLSKNTKQVSQNTGIYLSTSIT